MIKKNLKIVLFAVDYPLAGYLLELIRSAFWICDQYDKKEYDNIEVTIMLLQSPLNLSRNNVLKKLLSFLISFLGVSINNYLLSKISNVKNKVHSKIINKLLFIFESILDSAIIDKVYDKNSIYQTLKRDGKFLIKYNNLNINFQKQKNNYIFKLNILFKSIFTAIILYKNCFDKFSFLPQKFLNIHHNNIHIGDLVASYTVRIYSQTGGQLKNTLGLFINFVNGIYINNLASSTKIFKRDENFICPSEPFYTHQIWLRNFRKKDIHILEIHNPLKKFKICPSSTYNNPWIAEKPKSNNFNYELSNEYLNKRVYSPDTIIDSFSNKNFTNNNFEDEIYDDKGLKVHLDHTKLNIVLFLHDFSDALYADGLDGFNDLYEWTIFTLDKLFDNNSVEKILIKSHPSADFIASRANKIAFNKIYKIYKKNEKFIFLDKNSSLVALCKNKKLYGITHHGNIALELVYLDQPAIGWTNGPWGSHYQFLKTWKQKDDYADLLSGLKDEKWKPPSLKEKEILYMYICNFELKRMSSDQKSIRVYLTNNLKRLSGCGYKEFEINMRKIKVEDILFSEVLDKIYEKSLSD